MENLFSFSLTKVLFNLHFLVMGLASYIKKWLIVGLVLKTASKPSIRCTID